MVLHTNRRVWYMYLYICVFLPSDARSRAIAFLSAGSIGRRSPLVGVESTEV